MRGEIARLQNRLGTTTVYVTHDQTEAMTPGRPGGGASGVRPSRSERPRSYNFPANLFVAGSSDRRR